MSYIKSIKVYLFTFYSYILLTLLLSFFFLFPYLIEPTILTRDISTNFKYFLPLGTFALCLLFLILSIQNIRNLKTKWMTLTTIIGIMIYGLIFYLHFIIYASSPNDYLSLRLIPMSFDILILMLLFLTVFLFYGYKIRVSIAKRYPDIKITINGWREYIKREKLRPEKMEIVNDHLSHIRELIKERKLSVALSLINEVKNLAEKYFLPATWEEIKKVKEICQTLLTKKFMLNSGTKYERIRINEIMEKIQIRNEKLVIDTVASMIKDGEIFAEYFESTKTILYNKTANIREIDNLMKMYQDWEKGDIGEKKKN